jgi:hypothetical protein
VVKERKAHPKDVPIQYVMQPLSVKLSYLNKPWCSVLLEVGHNEIGDANKPDYVIPKEANDLLNRLGFDAYGGNSFNVVRISNCTKVTRT